MTYNAVTDRHTLQSHVLLLNRTLKREKAEKALRWIRGPSELVKAESQLVC